MTFLAFSNLTVDMRLSIAAVGGILLVKTSQVSFTATNTLDTQIIAGIVNTGDYELALSLSPGPDISPQHRLSTMGLPLSITLTGGGSGYVTNPAVTIVGSGSIALASATISQAL